MATMTTMTILAIIIVFNAVTGMVNDYVCSSRSQLSALSWWLLLLFSLAIIIHQSCVFVVVFHFLESEDLRTNLGAIVCLLQGSEHDWQWTAIVDLGLPELKSASERVI